jgi:transposase
MLNLAAARIWLCVEPTDMRKSFDTLAARVREHLRGDPLSGGWFVFRGKRGDRLKIRVRSAKHSVDFVGEEPRTG